MVRADPMPPASQLHRVAFVCGALALTGVATLGAAESAGEKLDRVIAQNAKLAEQVEAQQKELAALRTQVDRVTRESAAQRRELDSLHGEAPPSAAAAVASGGNRTVVLSGRAAAGFYDSGPDGQFPHSEFRVAEALLHVEAKIVEDVYAFAELKITERESTANQPYLGEFYVDVENLGKKLGLPGSLGLRVGRIDLPFGEEYLERDAIDGPLISHSLADFWGVDEGLELYGTLGKVSYVFAVQNGSVQFHRDFTADKSLILRLGGDPAPWLHLGASAMRTGDLDSTNDFASELWIGNGIFISIGNPATTTRFGAELVQLEARAKWDTGYVHAAAGRAWYDDNDTSRDNSREIDVHSVEAVQRFGNGWFGAARYSRISADLGYRFAGQGSVGKYVFGGISTKYLERLSVGVGFRFADPLVWKAEYSWEQGRTMAGWKRENSDTLSTEIAVKF